MYQGLTSALETVATWFQSASLAVPLSQLSVMTWVMFVISGLFHSKDPFNVPER